MIILPYHCSYSGTAKYVVPSMIYRHNHPPHVVWKRTQLWVVNGNSFKLILFQAINTLHSFYVVEAWWAPDIQMASASSGYYVFADFITFIMEKLFENTVCGYVRVATSIWTYAEQCAIMEHLYNLKFWQIQQPGHNVSYIIYDDAHKLCAIDRYTRFY